MQKLKQIMAEAVIRKEKEDEYRAMLRQANRIGHRNLRSGISRYLRSCNRKLRAAARQRESQGEPSE